MAEIYAAAFPESRPWEAAEISDILSGRFGFFVPHDVGFALGRVVAGEAELITIAVEPAHQGRGYGADILLQFENECRARGASEIFLEVAQDNPGALALYGRCGYAFCGERPGYYTRTDGTQIAASLMKKALN